VRLDGGDNSHVVRIVDTLFVADLCDAIRTEFGLPAELVVKSPKESLPADTDPKSVNHTTFNQVLDEPTATLADVLKPDIAGSKGKYRVYVELPAKPIGGPRRFTLPIPD